MSKRELARVEVLARVRSKQLRVVDAGRLMRVSYRQAKRLWKRYREEGAAGLQHRSAGRPSNHGHEKKFRQKVLGLVREKYEGSNVFLEREYLPEHNERFARGAARPEDYHRKAPCAAELERIFRLESERTVSDDWVVRYDNRFFQLEPQSGHIVPARSKVWVCEGRYGRMSIESGGRALRWREIAAPVPPQGLETAARPANPRVPISVKKRKWTPPPSHPWHEPPRPKVQKRARRLAAS